MVEVRPEIIGAVIQIIDLAASKGSFSGNDLSTVGAVRAELVDAVKEQKAFSHPAAETVEDKKQSEK
jgi:hypothetical protein